MLTMFVSRFTASQRLLVVITVVPFVANTMLSPKGKSVKQLHSTIPPQ
jgi:uncharacterized membrane protein AbrB (regulator of aidB expression)